MKRTEQDKAAFRERMKAFVGRVKAMSEEQREQLAARLGIVTCEGHALSPYNTAFLYYQCVGGTVPTVIGGFQQWRRADRQVQKGQHAIGYIYVPTRRPKTAEDQQLDTDADDRTRFMLVAVFDVTQTAEVTEMVTA